MGDIAYDLRLDPWVVQNVRSQYKHLWYEDPDKKIKPPVKIDYRQIV